jgi:hypothetical protein
MTSDGDVPATTVTIPSGVSIGEVTVELIEKTSLLKGTTKFTITVPTLALNIGTATMGESVTVSGSGWVPSSSVTITLKEGTTTKLTAVAAADSNGDISNTVTIPSTVGVGPRTLTFTASDGSVGNSSTAVNLAIPKATLSLSSGTATVGDVVEVVAAGFPPNSGLSILEIGGADVRTGVETSDSRGGLTVEFIVPGVTGSNLVKVKIGNKEVSTSLTVTATTAPAAAATDTPADIFADVIANSDNLVRVWRFANATQSWEFYDPRPAFESANTLEKSGSGDIVWVNVTAEQAFQSTTLFPGWNLISLD